MGLLESAAEAKALHDEATKAQRIAASIATWEARLLEARGWWTEHIGEPAEFYFPAGSGPPNYVEHKGVVAVCDGWSFYIDAFDHRRDRYGKGDGELAAYLIYEMNEHDRIALWSPPTYHADPPKLRSLADVGRALQQFEADERYQRPDPETLIWRKVKWG